MKKIYILGSLNMDLVISCNTLPKKGETIRGNNFHTSIGGKGLNQAISASKLGGVTKMLGAVGNDSFGAILIAKLKEYNIDTSNIKQIDNISSGIAVILLEKEDNRIILDLGANLRLSKEDVDSFLKDSKEEDIFLTQLENDIDIIGYALEKAKEKKMVTLVNPAPMNIKILKYSKYIDILTPNEGELLAIKEECKEIDIPYIIETRGKDGYVLYYKDEIIKNKAIEVKAIDTVGAGDAFNGAIAYQLSLGKSLNKETLDFASLVATISVTRIGSSESSPTLEEVNNFLKEYKK